MKGRRTRTDGDVSKEALMLGSRFTEVERAEIIVNVEADYVPPV
jgi:hypothetical protein